jgi:hypothetical protein
VWPNHFHAEGCGCPHCLFGCLGGQFEHALETSGCIHHQKAGFGRLDAEGVRDSAGERDESTGSAEMILASGLMRTSVIPIPGLDALSMIVEENHTIGVPAPAASAYPFIMLYSHYAISIS